jgi:hypothetical protein
MEMQLLPAPTALGRSSRVKERINVGTASDDGPATPCTETGLGLGPGLDLQCAALRVSSRVIQIDCRHAGQGYGVITNVNE